MINFLINHPTFIPFKNHQKVMIRLTYSANNRWLDYDSVNYNEEIKFFSDLESEIFDYLYRRYFNTDDNAEVTIDRSMKISAIKSLYRLNLIIADYLIKVNSPISVDMNKQSIREFVYEDQSAEGIFENYTEVDRLLKVFTILLESSDIYDGPFIPGQLISRYEGLQEWRFNLIENFVISISD